VLSGETAAASAEEHGVDRNREVALYIVHGLLHLHGFDDLGEEARRAMGRVQDEILGRLWG
ncbi:MAG: rRNA maturation RNase YbeY, partial [Verrucomicrobiales bacterium]